MSTVPKSNSRANIGNIPWEIVCDKFMIFRKDNEISGMTDKKIFDLFIKISPHPFSISSFRSTLKPMVAERIQKLKEKECPICFLSHWDIIEDEGVIWTSICNHPVCGECLVKTYLSNLTV